MLTPWHSGTPIWKELDKYKITGESFEWSHATMDAATASDLIDKMVLSIEYPIWIPQYNFDFDSIWHLVHQGISLEEVKKFLRIFHQGIKEKLMTPHQKEVSYDIMRQFIDLFQYQETDEPGDPSGEETKLLEKYDAGFDF